MKFHALNPNKIRTALKIFIALALLLIFASSIHGIIVDRPLVRDGSWWVFEILQNKKTSFGQNIYRYFSAVFELPALFISMYGEGHDLTTLIIKTWETSFVLAPFASLALCFYILKRHKQLRLASILLLGFALGTAIPMIYSTNQTAESIFLFWPLFLLLVLSPLSEKKDRALFLFFSVALAISHEAGILFFAFLAGLSAYRKQWLHLGIFSVGIISCLLRITLGSYPTAEPFLASLLEEPHLYFLPFLFCGSISLAALLRNKFKICFLEPWIIGLCILYVVIDWPSYYRELSIHWFLNSRGIGIPITIVMAFVFFILKNEDALWGKNKFSLPLYFLIGLCLLRAAALDERTNQQWSDGIQSLRNIADKDGNGCFRISMDEFRKNLLPNGINDYHLPLLSILIQSRKDPSHIIFLEDKKLYPNSPCEATGRYRIPFFETEIDLNPKLYFQIEQIKNGAIHLEN